MKFFVVSFVLVLSASLVSSQVPVNGSCPDLCRPFELNVTADQVAGLWYVQYSAPYEFEGDAKCSYLNNTKVADNSVSFEKLSRSKIDNVQLIIDGKTNFTTLGVQSNTYTNLELPLQSQLVVVTGDLMIEVACHTCGFYKKKGSGIYGKIYTRLPFPKCELKEEALKILGDCGIPRDFLIPQDHANCKDC